MVTYTNSDYDSFSSLQLLLNNVNNYCREHKLNPKEVKITSIDTFKDGYRWVWSIYLLDKNLKTHSITFSRYNEVDLKISEKSHLSA